eukprot:6086906-Prorocentrum_lima.AAC.1
MSTSPASPARCVFWSHLCAEGKHASVSTGGETRAWDLGLDAYSRTERTSSAACNGVKDPVAYQAMEKMV